MNPHLISELALIAKINEPKTPKSPRSCCSKDLPSDFASISAHLAKYSPEFAANARTLSLRSYYNLMYLVWFYSNYDHCYCETSNVIINFVFSLRNYDESLRSAITNALIDIIGDPRRREQIAADIPQLPYLAFIIRSTNIDCLELLLSIVLG